MGIGYVGNGLGLGTVLIVNSLLSGPTLLGMSGDLTATVGFIGGLSVPFDVLGMKIHLGGAVRPMIRIHVPVDSSVAFGMLYAVATNADVFAALNSANALYGVGIGLDAGAIAELGWFTFGISVRDLAGTQFRYTTSSYGVLWSALSTKLEFPTSGTLVTADTFTIPMDVAVGVALHPDMGTFNNILDPSVSIDLHDVVGALDGTASIWTHLHTGAELKILSFFTLRGGLNQGSGLNAEQRPALQGRGRRAPQGRRCCRKPAHRNAPGTTLRQKSLPRHCENRPRGHSGRLRVRPAIPRPKRRSSACVPEQTWYKGVAEGLRAIPGQGLDYERERRDGRLEAC